MSGVVDMMHNEAEQVQSTTDEGADIVKPYSMRGWAELAGLNLTPPERVWGGFTLDQVGAIIGQGGLGKSRIGLNIARNQVLGLKFAGLPSGARPLKHFVMGSENSIHRLQGDIRHMNIGLTAEQIALLNDHIRLATIEGPDDSYISLANPTNILRWQKTLESWPPDVLWVDPWGDIQAGEANNDEDARATLAMLRNLLRRVSPSASTIILAHARTGVRNIAQATGYDAANFGKGSKALFSSCRCVWNLAPGDESENPPLVCVHAKSNDGPRHPPVAIRLNPTTMMYGIESNFDIDAWTADLSSRANGKGREKKASTPLVEYRTHVVDVLTKEGKPLPSGVLHDRISAAVPGGLGQKRVAALVDDCLAAGIIAKTPRMKEHFGKVYIGTQEQISAMLNPALPPEGDKK